MKDSIEIKGLWWLPEDDNIQLPGTLSFSQQNGAILEIIGTFRDPFSNQRQDAAVILGMSQDGKQITLHRCIPMSWSAPVMSLGAAKYRAHLVFEGVHFEAEESACFSMLTAAYSDLDAWVDIYGFTIDYLHAKDAAFEAHVNYKKPSSILFDIRNDFQAGVSFAVSGPAMLSVQKEAIIRQEAYLFIKTANDDDVPFKDLFDLLNQFSYLHQLAVQRMNYPIRIKGTSKSNTQLLSDGTTYYPDIHIYFQPIEPFVQRQDKYAHEMLFTFKDLEDENLKAWFAAFPDYATMIHLYRSLFYTDRLFIDTRFLHITQALESLHGILFDGRYLSEEEFRRRRELALAPLADDLRDWVSLALGNANYKRLRLKIAELLGPKFHLFEGCVEDVDNFVKRVVATRNSFVHHNESSDAFAHGEELVAAINLLTYLFEAYILELLQLPEARIKELYKSRVQRHLSRWRPL
ncbi:MAG: hypothetical protein KF698_03745 [Anaerolineales bacterium]|nr:hypothetical protein [Anaerolineales bacterium]